MPSIGWMVSKSALEECLEKTKTMAASFVLNNKHWLDDNAQFQVLLKVKV